MTAAVPSALSILTDLTAVKTLNTQDTYLVNTSFLFICMTPGMYMFLQFNTDQGLNVSLLQNLK